MKYVVMPYVTCIVRIPVEADSTEEAIDVALSQENGNAIRYAVDRGTAEYVDEIKGVLVDVVGDTEYAESTYFKFNDDTNRWEAQ